MNFRLLTLFLLIFSHSFLPAVDSALEKQREAENFVAHYFPNAPKEKISIQILSGGYSDASNFLIVIEGKRFVLRMYPKDELEKRIQRELYSHQQAAQVGIAPPIYIVGDDGRSVFMEYIEGKTISIDQAKLPENCKKIAEALRKVHAIAKNPYPRSSFKERIEELYNELCSHLKNKETADAAMQIIRDADIELQKINTPKATIHGDLNPRNIFITQEGVKLIDWSETNWEDPFYDLSCFALQHDYSNVDETHLLENYLQHSPTAEEKKHYQLIKKANLATFSIIGQLFATKLQSEKNEKIDPIAPVKEWFYYVNCFANNNTEITAQFFHDWAKISLQRAQKE